MNTTQELQMVHLARLLSENKYQDMAILLRRMARGVEDEDCKKQIRNFCYLVHRPNILREEK